MFIPKKTSSEALSILIEAKKKGSSGGLKILKPLYVYDEENQYTDEICKYLIIKRMMESVEKAKNIR